MEGKERIIEVLNVLIEDCTKDVQNYEGKEFNGCTVATYFGMVEAKIEALAKILKRVVESSK